MSLGPFSLPFSPPFSQKSEASSPYTFHTTCTYPCTHRIQSRVSRAPTGFLHCEVCKMQGKMAVCHACRPMLCRGSIWLLIPFQKWKEVWLLPDSQLPARSHHAAISMEHVRKEGAWKGPAVELSICTPLMCRGSPTRGLRTKETCTADSHFAPVPHGYAVPCPGSRCTTSRHAAHVPTSLSGS